MRSAPTARSAPDGAADGSVTGYLVQRDQGAEAGSRALLAMSVICFLLVAVSVIRGERSFSRAEWAFLIAGVFVFVFYHQGADRRRGSHHAGRRAWLRADIHEGVDQSAEG
jgi:hypothetical protein